MIEQATRSQYRLGIMLVVVSAITFSTAGLFSKGVQTAPWDIIFWRGVFSAGFTTLWVWHRGQIHDNFPKMGISGVAVAAVGALGTAAFIAAFKLTTIANVSLIYAVAPMLAALLAWVWIGEKASRTVIAGSLLALAGVAIIVSGSLGQINLRGDLLALGMAVAMAILMVIYRRFPSTPGAGPSALSSLLLVPVAFFLGNPLGIPVSEILILSAFGLVFAIASVTLAEGAKRVPSGQTALLSTLEVPLAPVLAFLILSEVPHIRTIAGGALVLIAVVLATCDQK
ncbi:DMT family transporter [Ruegeria sp. EL01]|uniref:DMT family transporter n=1 Tax=Ruegeria sp. EL01 TaxID=2107578 RepID=UPI000EA821F3|nr:DMT family transporter [Ruegeria sp. EL01]